MNPLTKRQVDLEKIKNKKIKKKACIFCECVVY